MFHRFLESHGRSILKAFSWKVIASILSFLVIYYQTGDARQAFDFSITIFFIGFVVYYLHERVWNMIHWGKKQIGDQ